MNRFENLGLAVQRDLDVVRYARRKDISMPKFHYEKKNFSIVRCNTDLTDNELEIVVVRGINYNVSNPKDVDTYVKVEFPLLNVSGNCPLFPHVADLRTLHTLFFRRPLSEREPI